MEPLKVSHEECGSESSLIRSSYKVKYASLSETKKPRQYHFQYFPDEEYYITITSSLNPQFCREKKGSHLSSSFSSKFANLSNKNKIPSHFNFDYKKYNLSLCIGRSPSMVHSVDDTSSNISGNMNDIVTKIPLTSENVSIYQTTKETLDKFYHSKTIDNKKDFAQFKYELEYHYIIEIETRKHPADTSVSEDGVVNVTYFLIKDRDYYSKIFSTLIYLMLFSRQSLENYITKYIYDMIYKFCNLPYEEMIDVLKHFKLFTKENEECIKPVKKEMKMISKLNISNKIKHLRLQIPNIRTNDKLASAPFHKVILLDMKYDNFFNEKDFKLSKKKFDILTALSNKHNLISNDSDNLLINSQTGDLIEMNYDFILKSLEPPVSETVKDKKIDVLKLGKELFNIINISILSSSPKQMNTDQIKRDTRTFFINYLEDKLKMYCSYHGFFKIDSIINDDRMLQCTPCGCCCFCDKKKKQKYNDCFFSILDSLLNVFNNIFSANDGFFHKHLSVNEFSYNFNEKNVIYIFPHTTDASLKNKFRIFDIPMHSNWLRLISGLILMIYENIYDFLNFEQDNNDTNSNNNNMSEQINDDVLINSDNNNDDNNSNSNKSASASMSFKVKLFTKFQQTCEYIIDKLFMLYKDGLPDYEAFCDVIVSTPLKGYNRIDNVCQHFANESIEKLIHKTSKILPIFDCLFIKQSTYKFPKPRYNCLLEPYLILCDKKFQKYLEAQDKPKFIEDNNGIITTFKQTIKQLTSYLSSKAVFNMTPSKTKQNELEIIMQPKETDDKEATHVSFINANFNNSGDKLKLSDVNLMKLFVNANFTDDESNKYIYDYMFLFNLVHYHKYQTMQKIKRTLIHYSVISRFIDYTINHEGSSQGFADLDNSVFNSHSFYSEKLINSEITEDVVARETGDVVVDEKEKQKRKNLKKELIECYDDIHAIHRTGKKLTKMNYDYVQHMIKEVYEKVKMSTNYIRVGYYLINVDSFGENNEEKKYEETFLKDCFE